MEKDKAFVDRIQKYIIAEAQREFGYAGLAAAPDPGLLEWQGPWKCDKCGFVREGVTHRRLTYRECGNMNRCNGKMLPYDRRASTARQVYILLRDAKKNHLTDKQVNAIAFALLKNIVREGEHPIMREKLEALAKTCDELAEEMSVHPLTESAYKLVARDIRAILAAADNFALINTGEGNITIEINVK